MTLEAGLIVQSANGDTPVAANTALPADAESTGPEAQETLKIVMARLDDDQAQNVVPIDLKGKSDVADAMVIASGRSQRHVGAMADKIARELKEAGVKSVAIEGLPACDWVLIDAGDVVVHLFRPEVREFYNLERIWAPELFEESAGEGEFSPATDAISVAPADED
ncbi:MAG: ribosome silencing factor [Pseudomonadota bacterium]